MKTREELALSLPKALAISETEVIRGSPEQTALSRPYKDITKYSKKDKRGIAATVSLFSSAVVIIAISPFQTIATLYVVHLLNTSSVAIATVCLERGFPVVHIILIMGAKRNLIILVKLYPVPNIVLKVSSPTLATLISLKYAPKG